MTLPLLILSFSQLPIDGLHDDTVLCERYRPFKQWLIRCQERHYDFVDTIQS